MPDPTNNPGYGLVLSEPLTRITDAIASIGRAVQSGDVPQSVKDAWEAVKKHVSDAQKSVEDTASSVTKKVSDAIAPKVKAEELLTRKEGPDQYKKSSQPGIISQNEFASKLREKYPALKDYTDSQIVNAMIAKRPDIADKVENPAIGDRMAAAAQAKTEQQSKNQSAFMRSVLSALPGTGAMVGGLLAAPETFGTGAVLGSALGAGAGRGAQDLLEQYMGLSDTSPMQKATNIGVDTAITGLTPGIIDSLKTPIKSVVDSARGTAGLLSDFERALIPPRLRPWLSQTEMLDKFAKGGSSEIDPLVRPQWQINQSLSDAVAKPKLRINLDGTISNLETGEILGSVKPNVTPANSSLPEPKGKFNLHLGNYISGQ